MAGTAKVAIKMRTNDNEDEIAPVGAGRREAAATSTNPPAISPTAEFVAKEQNGQFGSHRIWCRRIGGRHSSLASLTADVERQLSAQVIEHHAHSRGGAGSRASPNRTRSAWATAARDCQGVGRGGPGRGQSHSLRVWLRGGRDYYRCAVQTWRAKRARLLPAMTERRAILDHSRSAMAVEVLGSARNAMGSQVVAVRMEPEGDYQ